MKARHRVIPVLVVVLLLAFGFSATVSRADGPTSGGTVFLPFVPRNTPPFLDSTFGRGGMVLADLTTIKVNGGVGAYGGIALQLDGRIVFAGGGNQANDANTSMVAARFSTSGALDAAFGTGGSATKTFPSVSAAATAVAIQPDGKIVEVGAVSDGSFQANWGWWALARFTSDGLPDATFAGGGGFWEPGCNGPAAAVVLQPGGTADAPRIVVGGVCNNVAGLRRFLSDGTPDLTFGNSGMAVFSDTDGQV